MNSKRFESLSKKVYELALQSSGIADSQYRLAAIMVNKKGIIVSKGTNSYKTHPLFKKFYKYPYHHAEGSCIINRGINNIDSSDIIFVARVGKKDTLLLAKPCKSCQELIRFVGIREVYYSNANGVFEKMILEAENE